MKLPGARTENLLEQNLEKETLIYDLSIDKALNLNETLTIVYKACGQNQTFDELKRQYKFNDDFIYLALDELKQNNLLKEKYASPSDGANRREVIKKVGLATMFALPIITGLVAPKSTNAASNNESGGTTLYGACAQSGDTGVCFGGLNCVGGRNGICCQSQPTGRASFLEGDSIPLGKKCYSGGQSGDVLSCDEFQAAEYCCSARASGSCVVQNADEYLDSSDGPLPVCYDGDGGTNSYSMNVVCSCTCS